MRKTKERLWIFAFFIAVNVFLVCGIEPVKAEEMTCSDEIKAEECAVITSDMLRDYYQNGLQVCITGNGYSIWLDGSDICNYENELHTQMDLQRTENGILFEVNQGKKLCGDLRLEFEQYVGDNLYLYNESKEKYELLKAMDSSGLYITQEGTYLLTEKKEVNDNVKKAAYGGGIILLAGMIVGYVWVKKRYWFW